jgi:ABC-type glycerol-3-phosphate transport system substrate-binding protein
MKSVKPKKSKNFIWLMIVTLVTAACTPAAGSTFSPEEITIMVPHADGNQDPANAIDDANTDIRYVEVNEDIETLLAALPESW